MVTLLPLRSRRSSVLVAKKPGWLGRLGTDLTQERKNHNLPSPQKVAHRYVTFLCSWDVEI